MDVFHSSTVVTSPDSQLRSQIKLTDIVYLECKSSVYITSDMRNRL